MDATMSDRLAAIYASRPQSFTQDDPLWVREASAFLDTWLFLAYSLDRALLLCFIAPTPDAGGACEGDAYGDGYPGTRYFHKSPGCPGHD